MLPNLEQLPADIRQSTRAVVWKFEPRAGEKKPTKVPYQAHRPNTRAAVDKPKTWGSFQEAFDAVADGKADGVGIVLGDGLVGVDLDQVRNPQTGTITTDAQTVIKTLDSYTEISPSHAGIHVLVRGSLPPGRRRNSTGIEMYSDGRYFTLTGDRLPDTPGVIHERTEQLRLIHAHVFRRTPRATTATPSAAPSVLTDAALLAKAMTAINGARFAALWGGDLSAYDGDESAADLGLCNLLAFYTGRDADRIDRLFRQSGLMRPKWTTRRGETTYGGLTIAKAIADCTETFDPTITITIDDIIDDEPDRPSSTVTVVDDGWPRLHPDALVGLFGDVIEAVAPQTEADPVGILSHTLAYWGSLVGRSPHVQVGTDSHHVNENVLVAGDTSIGRKGLANVDAQTLMALVDPDWHQTCLVSGLSTGEGLIHSVRDALEGQEPIKVGGKVIGYQTVIKDAGIADKRRIVVEPEFARTLRVARREGNTLSAVIRQAWDTGTLRVLTRQSPVTATGAHISVIAHCTPHELRQELKAADLASGFLNRFIVLLVRRSQLLPEGGRVPAAVREALVKRFMTATDAARRVGLMTRDSEAVVHWHQIYPQLTRERSGLLGALCNRAPAHVLRLACLYALADESPVIRSVHQRAALAMWTYAETSAMKIFGRRLGHRLGDYLLSLLRQHPHGLTRTEISQALGRNRHADEISEALRLLADYGLARSLKTQEGGGPPTTRWYCHELTK